MRARVPTHGNSAAMRLPLVGRFAGVPRGGRTRAAVGEASSTRVLIILATFMLGASVLSDTLLTRSTAFWTFCRERATSMATRPLKIEAKLRSRPPGTTQIAFVGSSVVAGAINSDRIAQQLDLDAGDVLLLAIPAADTVEVSMLAGELIRARPRLVVHLATVWALWDHVTWTDLRLYDPAVAVALLGWRDLLAQHDVQASLLLGWSHVVIRHRAALRDILFAPILDGTARLPARPAGEVREIRRRLQERRLATPEDFACPNIHTRALGVLARRLRSRQIPLAVVATPANDWRRAPLRPQFNECLSAAARADGFVFVSESALPRFDGFDFRDATHMSARGQLKLTDALIPELRRLLAATPARR